MSYKIRPLVSIQKELIIPPDKSISHRAVILASIAQGKTKIKNFLDCEDTRATLTCLKRLGVKIQYEGKEFTVSGCGKYFPKPEREPLELNANESGTTIRILTGLLCTQRFPVKFEGAVSLKKRPMARIIEPLREMGAKLEGDYKEICGKTDIYAPLFISPAENGLKGIDCQLEVSSAQVKSAIILAALYAKGETKVKEPYQSRDHTERILKLFKANFRVDPDRTIVVNQTDKLEAPTELFIPADFSGAAFFIVLGLILKNSQLLIKGVNINPTRCGLLRVLERMGAAIEIENRHDDYEPYADLKVKSSELKPVTVNPEEIPSMIDEIPILCVAASFAKGTSRISGLAELRVKEADRLESIRTLLKDAGVNIRIVGSDTIEIEGQAKLSPAEFKSFSDHRTAMSAVVLGSVINGCSVDDTKCIDKSSPEFISLIESLQK